MADAPASTTPADSPEVTALKRSNALLEQRVLELERLKKIVDALTPGLPEGAKGTIALDGQPVECRLLAYREINLLAQTIAARLRGSAQTPRIERVVIHDAAILPSLTAFRAFDAHLTQLARMVAEEIALAKALLAQAAKPAPTKEEDAKAGEEHDAFEAAGAVVAGLQLAPMAAGAVLKTITGIAALFRQDVSIKNSDLTIADAALVAAVCGELAGGGVVVYHPSLGSPDTIGQSSGILDGLAALAAQRVELDALLDALTAAQADKTDPTLKALTDKHARLTALAKSLDDMREALFKADATSGVMPLAPLLRAEALTPLVESAHVLSLTVAGAGGGSELRQAGTFRSGKRLFSGGVIVQFILFDGTGRVVDAATLPSYSGLVQSEEGERQVNLMEPDPRTSSLDQKRGHDGKS